MTTFQQILLTLQQPVFGNHLQQWVIAAATTLFLFVLFLTLRRTIAARFLALSERRGYPWAQVAEALTRRTGTIFLIVLALYCGSLLLDLPPKPLHIRLRHSLFSGVLSSVSTITTGRWWAGK